MDISKLLAEMRAYRGDVDRAIEALEAIARGNPGQSRSNTRNAATELKRPRRKAQGMAAPSQPPLVRSATIIPFIPVSKPLSDTRPLEGRTREIEDRGLDDRSGTDRG